MIVSRNFERIVAPVVLVILAILVGFATYRMSLLSSLSEAVPVVVLHVDLERGLSWRPPETLKFPPRRLDLTCYLPDKSSGRDYQVHLNATDGRRLIDVGRFLVRAGRVIEIKLDLRYTPQGKYVLELVPDEGTALRYPLRVLT